MRFAVIPVIAALAFSSSAALARTAEWRACANTGSPDVAIAACTQLIEGMADQPTSKADRSIAHFNRGAAHSGQRNYVSALRDYNAAITLNPRLANAYNGRGVVLALTGRHAPAIEDYGRALAIDPDFADALNNRADALRELGEFDRALADLDRLITLRPDFADAYYTRGELRLDQGDLARAQADIERAIRLDAGGPNRDFGESLLTEIRRRQAPVDPVVPETDERRVALVIGNGDYRQASLLANPRNDADAIAAGLRQTGFDDVTVAHDLDRAGMVAALQAFGPKADEADWAVIYFAGHGLEIGGANYLVPVDASLVSDRNVPDEAISLDRMLAAAQGARKLRLVMLDACRNNPFLARMRSTSASRSIGRGLARVEPTQATLVAFAAKGGTIAEDGAGDNSPFAAALARRITETGVEINKVFRFVRSDVLATTDNRQEPFVYGSLPPEDFFFVPPD